MSQPSAELDGIDFRPFFDMVVGILFVLLILVGALIFFQQTGDGVAASPAREELRRWRAQRGLFLERLAADLVARSLPARADTAAGAVLVELDALAQPEEPGLPSLRAPAVAELAAGLALALACVSLPRARGPTCGEIDLLSLDALSVQVRLGATPPDAAMPRDHAARFFAAALSTALYADAPALLMASDRAGGAAVAFDDGTVGTGYDGAPGTLALAFFARP